MKPMILAFLAIAGSTPAMAAGGQCLLADRIDGFIDAKRDSVVLTAGFEKYRAEFIGGCVGLEWAENLATTARTGCLEPGDHVNFVDNGNISRRCLIDKLTDVTPPKT